MSRPSTAGSTALPGRRSPGVKGALFRLEQKVGEHEGILQVLTKQEDAAADDTKDIFAQMKNEFQSMMDEMRTEMTDKLKAAYVEIERLRKQLSIVKGEQTIHNSQLKDQSKVIQVLELSVSNLQRELNGDIDDYD